MIHQKGSRQKLIIFTRYPAAGRTKTRLIPVLGPEGAAHLQRTMTQGIVHTVKEMAKGSCLHIEVCYTGGSLQLMQEWLGKDIDYNVQHGDDLGQRMYNAFANASQKGAEMALIIGSDCPELDRSVILEAMAALNKHQLVIGPSTDGGYYLIGAKCDLPAEAVSYLLADIAWGTPGVFQETLDRARKIGLQTALLKELNDIDLPSDLKYFDHYPDPQ